MSMASAVRPPSAAPVNAVLLTVALLLAAGLVMMTSASVELAESRHGDPFHHLKRQAAFAVAGMAAMLAALHVPMAFWRRAGGWMLLLSCALLALVLVPGVGVSVNGSARWLDLGLFHLQPSEPAKASLVLYLAAHLERNAEAVRSGWRGLAAPAAAVAACSALLLLEPDHGAVAILALAGFGMVFLAGAGLRRVLPALLAAAAAAAWLAAARPYALARLSSFLNPWAAENVYGTGYQLTQALIAFGRGEWFGAGLGRSVQKLYFLPEAHNDFVLAIVGEELGLAGVVLVAVLFGALVQRGFAIGGAACRRGDLFGALTARGVSLLFAGQAMINAGVNVGLLPTKGLTLPFLSYGGASLLVSCFMAALLVRVQYETERGGPPPAGRDGR